MSQQVNQVALITGGARGQGAAHATALAATGARVVIADVRDEDGAATAQELTAQGLSVRYAHLDVTDEAAWTEVVAGIEAQEGGLDILVNNAGIIRVTRLTELDVSEWDLLQRVNATSVLFGIKIAGAAVARSSTSLRRRPTAAPRATARTRPPRRRFSLSLARRRSSWRRKGSGSTLSARAGWTRR